MFDVLGLGYVAVDEVIYVERFPPPDAKTQVLLTERYCGGLTATALVAAARLGSQCAYAGALGADELSAFAKAKMQREGINLANSQQRNEAGPVHSFIVVDETRQTRNIFFDTSKAIGPDADWPEAEVIRSARVLLVDNCCVAPMVRAAGIARRARIPVVADFEGGSGPEFAELLSLVDHLILSESFAQVITGSADPATAAKLLWTAERNVVVVTCGAKGCWYLAEEGLVQHCPCYKVKAVDTTGCGDVFHGAYASALARGMELPQRIRFASAAAALKATQPGGQTGIQTRAGVEAFLREHQHG